MNLQSVENWCLYLAITDIKNIEMLKMYRSLNKLNNSITKQTELDTVVEEELNI